MRPEPFMELFSLLCDAVYRAHVSGTPSEFRESLEDGLLHTSDVSRAAALYMSESIYAKPEKYIDEQYLREALERLEEG